ncbi:MAG: hypothetical protein Salg2KO_14850 [Salibacteraceae bacterium]
MIRNKVILNSDTVNKYGFQFSVVSLLDALEQKAIEGVPTCLGHDMHRPRGWTVPFDLYFEPGMCRLVGNQVIAETDNEQKFINETHQTALIRKYQEQCDPHTEEFKGLIAKHLSDTAKYMYAGCVCYTDEGLLERVFPELWTKRDKDGLIYLSDLLTAFDYKGHGVFKHKKSELAVIAHRYFRKSLSIHNNLNYFFIDKLISKHNDENITVRIALDRNIIGYAKTYQDSIELEYWRGPKFNDDISGIKPGVTVYKSNDFQQAYYGISSTEFWWKNESDKQTLEAEELKEHPSLGLNDDNYGCRYVHSIYDRIDNSFEHFDGAIRMYDTERMLDRLDNDIKGAGKCSDYTKLFRVDGKLSLADRKTLVCHYFQSNPLIHEYFGEPPEVEPQMINQDRHNVTEKLVPYSINQEDGVRLMISYHATPEGKEEAKHDRYVSGYDIYSSEKESMKVIEGDII